MNGARRRVLRLLGGVVVLAVVGWQLGAAPFLQGLRAVTGRSLAVAVALTAVATLAAGWRWSLVSRALGLPLGLAAATASCYRSQFLNTVLPGGVLGDVHRAVDHGRDAGDVGRGLRSVVWERTAGQLVQVGLASVVLVVLPSPVPGVVPVALAVVGVVVAAVLLGRQGWPPLWSQKWSQKGTQQLSPQRPAGRLRVLGTVGADARATLLSRTTGPRVLLASLVVVAGHTAVFLVAVRAVGVTAPTEQLLPLVVLVMLAMTVLANLGGWGPREGAAAALFAAAGLGAGPGVAAATAYGVLVLVAALPGAVVLAAAALTSRRGSAGSRVPVAARPR